MVELPRHANSAEIEEFADRFLAPELRAAAKALVSSGSDAPVGEEGDLNSNRLVELQTVFGWGTEDVDVQINAMAADGTEATFCMGDDAPLAVLSDFPHSLYDYFKQRFAQVTNPPIDPLREGAVMSLSMYLGPKGDTLSLEAQNDVRVKIDSPILNQAEADALASMDGVEVATVSTLYPMTTALALGGLKETLEKICDAAVEAVRNGATVVNLSDKPDPASGEQGLRGSAYIPPLLAVGAVHHRLIDLGLRPQASIMVTTGNAWNTHHFACLVGYGASAIVPYAAYDAVINWHGQTRIQNAMNSGKLKKVSVLQAIDNFRKASDKGLLKVSEKDLFVIRHLLFVIRRFATIPHHYSLSLTNHSNARISIHAQIKSCNICTLL